MQVRSSGDRCHICHAAPSAYPELARHALKCGWRLPTKEDVLEDRKVSAFLMPPLLLLKGTKYSFSGTPQALLDTYEQEEGLKSLS